MKHTLPDRVRLRVFEVDLRAGELRLADRSILLQEQPFQILQLLIERDGGLVTREDIQKKLWPNDTVVDFDHCINAAVKKLRTAFGDTAGEPKYVETVARRGYRLLASVERVSESGDDRQQRPAPQSPHSPTTERTTGHITGCLIGKKVSHYRVLEVVGGGGMGLIYKAEDLKLQRRVALKFLPEELAWDPVSLQRFEREARTASSLDHPNICTIYEVEEYAEQPFIVMQLLEGETLRDRLAAEGKPFPLALLLDIARQIGSGLQAAHEKGIIHRDIKPANIFLTTLGHVKLLDFGLAKLVNSLLDCGSDPLELDTDNGDGTAIARRPDATLTRIGAAMGTAGYMSPEQVRGQTLDARSDLFSFGLVLYEMATGKRAFRGDTTALVQDAILNQPLVPVHELNPAVPAKLVAIIEKALEKDRDLRYQSAAEILADLGAVATVPRRSLMARHGPLLISMILLILLAAGMVGGFLYWRSHRKIQIWKGADPDLVIYQQAKAEYAKLQ